MSSGAEAFFLFQGHHTFTHFLPSVSANTIFFAPSVSPVLFLPAVHLQSSLQGGANEAATSFIIRVHGSGIGLKRPQGLVSSPNRSLCWHPFLCYLPAPSSLHRVPVFLASRLRLSEKYFLIVICIPKFYGLQVLLPFSLPPSRPLRHTRHLRVCGFEFSVFFIRSSSFWRLHVQSSQSGLEPLNLSSLLSSFLPFLLVHRCLSLHCAQHQPQLYFLLRRTYALPPTNSYTLLCSGDGFRSVPRIPFAFA